MALARAVVQPALFPLLSAVFSSWCVTLLLVGRSAPWQATRAWLLVFAVLSVLLTLWWWPVISELRRGYHGSGHRGLALWWALGLSVLTPLFLVLASYASEGLYGILVYPEWRVQVLVAVALSIVALVSMSRAAVDWSHGSVAFPSELASALSSEMRRVSLLCLLAIGVLQSMAMSTPIGDDIGKYTEAALAMLDGLPYPVHQAGADLIAAGMTANSPALPGLSVLLAGSFAVIGRDFAGLAIMLGAIAVLFPLAVYAAALTLTRSHLTAFTASVLLTLLPPYQIHILGTAVPDTLFVVVLLFAAAAAARAVERPTWPRWALAGFVVGLVANSRPEGLNFSLAILGWLAVAHVRRFQYWVGVLVYVLTVLPFSITYLSVAGSPWPTTFGGTVGTQHLQPNLTYLRELTLPWYEQAFGLDTSGMILIGVVVAVLSLLGLLAMMRNRFSMTFVPLLGHGYIAASLFVHPLILMSFTPVDVLRHWSSGVPYIALTLAYAAHRVFQAAAARLSGLLRTALVALVVIAVALGIYYECERLARPEWYFGGRTSLLWTGGSYLLADVVRNPIPLPDRDDRRTGEEMRNEQAGRLATFNLRHTNAGEPYHWATMMIALFGLAHAALPSLLGSVGRRRSAQRARDIAGDRTPRPVGVSGAGCER